MEDYRGAPGQPAQMSLDDLLRQARVWADETGLTRQVERSPLLAVAGAVVAGYVLGGVLGGRGPVGAMLGGIGAPAGGQGRRMRTSDFARRHHGA